MVRLSLVHRDGLLLGERFNVRESRAEPGPGRTLRLLGPGRLLSWRWVNRAEARRVLRARLETLQGLGYRELGGTPTRGPWDWLAELAQRSSEGGPEHATALREAVLGLGLSGARLMEGIASALGLQADDLTRPGSIDGQHLADGRAAALLPLLCEHGDSVARQAGARWLATPRLPYEIDRERLEAWLAEDGPVADALAPRLAEEGLALLGPRALRRLHRESHSPAVRRATARWEDRLR
jgi:hypothetical protein